MSVLSLSISGCFDFTPEVYTGLCSSNRACKDGTMCVDGVCRTICDMDDACPSDMICLDSACLPLVEHPCDPTAAATGLFAVVSPDRIDLTWESEADDSYDMAIQRDVGGAGFAEIARVRGSARVYSDASEACRDANVWCRYRVQAQRRRDGCLTATSGIVRTAAVPEVPQGLTASTLGSGVDIVLEWTDPNLYEDGYQIERAEAGSNAFEFVGRVESDPEALGAAMTFTDAGLLLDTALVYRVTAFSESVSYAGPVGATVAAWTSPISPVELAAESVSSTAVALSWQGHATETAYLIERAAPGGGFAEVATIERADSYTDTTTTPDTQFTYRVSAVNQSIEAEIEAQRSDPAVVAVWTRPSNAQALGAEIIAGVGVRLEWDDVNANETAVRIERRLVGESDFALLAVLAPNITWYLDEASATADYRVTVVNEGGDSAPALVGATSPAGAARALEVETTSPHTLRLHWSDGNPWGTGYRVERRRPDGSYEVLAAALPAHSTSFADTGLLEDTSYEYRVIGLGATSASAATAASGRTSFNPRLSWVGLPVLSETCALALSGTAQIDEGHGASMETAEGSLSAEPEPEPTILATASGISLVFDSEVPLGAFEAAWRVNDSLGGTAALPRLLRSRFEPQATLTALRRPDRTVGGEGMLGGQRIDGDLLPVLAGCNACGGRRASIAAGGGFSVALTQEGRVLSWGTNGRGQLGDGTTGSRAQPGWVCESRTSGVCTPLEGAVAVDAGYLTACALLRTGGVRCWGADTTIPAVVRCGAASGADCPAGAELLGAVAVALGRTHQCALLQSGRIKCWGYNYDGELGNGTREYNMVDPVGVCLSGTGPDCAGGEELTNAVGVFAGVGFSCALFADGAVKCWGANGGRLGNGTTTDRELQPVPVCLSGSGPSCDGGSEFSGGAMFGGGEAATYAITQDGHVFYWPDSAKRAHELCYSGEDCADLDPVTGAVDIVHNGYNRCILLESGNVSCAGENSSGQLGVGTTAPIAGFVETVIDGSAVAIAASFQDWSTPPTRGQAVVSHSCAVSRGGTVKCWGANTSGEIGNGTTTVAPSPTTVSETAAWRACGNPHFEDR